MWVAVERQSIRFFIQKSTKKKHRVKPNSNRMNDDSKKIETREEYEKREKRRERACTYTRARAYIHGALSLCRSKCVKKCAYIRFVRVSLSRKYYHYT